VKKRPPWEESDWGSSWEKGHGARWDKEQWSAWKAQRGPAWKGPGCGLFLRFLFVFGLILLLVLGGMAALALLFTRASGGSDQVALAVWVAGCGLGLALPILALTIAYRAYRRIANPLAEVMAAADAVAAGDLTVRVGEANNNDQFTRLARSFNRMTAELEREDELRRNLTADVAHELRTPLHIIQGNLEGVLDGVYEADAAHIEATLEETRMLGRLVDDLHLLSQAEAGQLSLRRERVDVPELLADVETSFSGQAAAREIMLTVAIAGDPAALRVYGDADRLDQVLSNLVANALRHTPPGGRVTMEAARADGQVRISVADNGEGIAAADLPHVFDRFWRGDKARGPEGGAGLGLAIARQLVEAHGGAITAVSEGAPGQGARFTITLPVTPSAVEPFSD
jgi:two-component system sensor histidine kinase BaeS